MRKLIFVLLITAVSTFAACQGSEELPSPRPTVADSEPTKAPEPTATVAPTPEPTATVAPTPEPTVAATPTAEPTATVIPTVEPTVEPTVTPVPTEILVDYDLLVVEQGYNADGTKGDYEKKYYRAIGTEQKLVKRSCYYEDDTLEVEEIWGYDESGNQTLYAYHDDECPEEDYQEEWTYDKNGDVLTYTLCVDGKQAERKEYVYDSFRNVTKYTIYNSEDEETYWCVVTYDKQGRQLELQSMNLLKDELRIGAWKYREDGTLESSTHEFYCESNYKRVCEYDSEGKQSVSREYGWIESEDGTFGFDTQCRQRIVYSEADNGKKKISTYYSGEDVFVGSHVGVFDEFGNETQYYSELPDGTIGIAYEKEYLAEGQLKSAKLYDTDGTMYEREEYRYDSFGNLIFKGIYNEKDELKEGTEYEYDAEITDRITQSKHYWGESGTEAITLYEYYERTEEDD